MHLDTARCLAAYINDNSTRFTATVLTFSQQAWVILRDNKDSHSQVYVEPIVNVADYLVRAERRSPRLEDEYRSLLVSWLELHPDQRVSNPDPTPDPAPARLSLADFFSSKFRF